MRNTITIMLLSILLAGCGRPASQEAHVACYEQPENEDVKNIVTTLQKCQIWLDLGVNDDAARLEITNTYKKLMHYDNATIRAALRKIESMPYPFPGDKMLMASKAHALLRVLFEIPPGDRPSDESNAYAAIPEGVPSSRKDYNVNILWPYTLDASGELILIKPERDTIHQIPPYYLTEEFDFMVKFYKRRPVTTN